jgi:glycerol kinase
MSERTKLISALGLASIAAMSLGQDLPLPRWEKSEETKEHKEYRAERQAKRKMQRKSRKANRS